jgi:hypothetical protein
MKNFISDITDNNDYPAYGVVLQIVQGIQVKVCDVYLLLVSGTCV